mgnify:CR=1 FL=1
MLDKQTIERQLSFLEEKYDILDEQLTRLTAERAPETQLQQLQREKVRVRDDIVEYEKKLNWIK